MVVVGFDSQTRSATDFDNRAKTFLSCRNAPSSASAPRHLLFDHVHTTGDPTMQFMILAYEHDDAFASRDDPDRAGDYWAAWSGYLDAIGASGVLVGAGGLLPPSSATTLRLRDGERMLQDGPFAASKEHLGGYFVVEVDSLDDALVWAERCPSAEYASVEVRPLLPPPPAM
jgi:hypothetical protein